MFWAFVQRLLKPQANESELSNIFIVASHRFFPLFSFVHTDGLKCGPPSWDGGGGRGGERERPVVQGSNKCICCINPGKFTEYEKQGLNLEKGTKDRMSSCFPCRSFSDRASQKFYVSNYTQSRKPLENFWEIFAIFFFKLQSQFCPFLCALLQKVSPTFRR